MLRMGSNPREDLMRENRSSSQTAITRPSRISEAPGSWLLMLKPLYNPRMFIAGRRPAVPAYGSLNDWPFVQELAVVHRRLAADGSGQAHPPGYAVVNEDVLHVCPHEPLKHVLMAVHVHDFRRVRVVRI